jgi:acyl transferase domain-containing protein/NAD(P)-dependent dehydrogenase (short-subunit alcohol dehydrogenase family)/acyl carrier protein
MDSADRAIAIVGVGAVLPDALNAPAFWQNILNKRYSITDVPPERWDPAFYFDPDPHAPDKTYSKIGGWVRGYQFDWKQFRMPPKVAAAMDESQQWAVTIAAEAMADYGYPERPLPTERTAVILGTAMGGELHYITQNRIVFPEYASALQASAAFNHLSPDLRQQIIAEWHSVIDQRIPAITEDTMPGELANIVSGRVANLLNLRGPNFITDAACASSFAAVKAAIDMLAEHQVDAVIAGGVDRNMGAPSFVKFCKIGALSATGSRPFGDGADGFVMGEGAGAFLLKRLSDAERNGDKIYAVIRGVGGSSDGKGKGITAPNPIGQELAIARAWEIAGLDPATATLVEAHGTSTRVGDVVEVESLAKVFGGAARQSIAIGSAKSNIGHLKAGAGAAGMLKATMAVYHKILPPTLNAEKPNPNIDFSRTPFYPNHEAREWATNNGAPRRCGVSAYGFGGTNFHVVLEEHMPGALTQKSKVFASTAVPQAAAASNGAPAAVAATPAPVRGIFALGAATPLALQGKLDEALERVRSGWTPPMAALPGTAVIQSAERLVVDYGDHDELLDRLQKARKVMSFDNPQAWKAMQAQGIFRGSGQPSGKIAFLFPGQGSQYVNMGRELAELSPTVAKIFEEADAVMKPILGKPLTDYIFVKSDDQGAVMQANFDLMQTEICQPAMLTLDTAMMALLADYGFKPDMVMGHSLGEYAALIAADIMPFAHALEAAAARGSEMANLDVPDNGKMAAVLAPYDVVEKVLAQIDGYVVPANINSKSQCVIGGSSTAVERAVAQFEAQGYRAMTIPVSHAFHTSIVAPASIPLRQVLDRLDIRQPTLPLVANVTGGVYPTAVDDIKDILQKQIASPVQWVKGLETLYDEGVRTFVEVGPKRALRGFVNDIFGDKEEVIALMTNHPKQGTLPTFNQALCGLYAAGYSGEQPVTANNQQITINNTPAAEPVAKEEKMDGNGVTPGNLEALSQLLAQALQQTNQPASQPLPAVYDYHAVPTGSVVVSGTGLGLPGAEKAVMDPDNALRILQGEQFVDLIPERFRKLMVNKRITRIVKAADGSGSFATIDDPSEVIKLAGRPGSFDLEAEYGVDGKLIEALDITSQLAMAAGLDALREAGIPLVMAYKKTTTGKYLPLDWKLPEALRDETGVIFASAFPGGDRFAEEMTRYYTYVNRRSQLEALEDLRRYTNDSNTLAELNRRVGALRAELEREPYTFDRRFLFRILAMGHSQFAQYIGARGPNTHVNAACASTAQGVALAEDWIRNGRCRRVIVLGADNVTGDHLMEWVGAGFLAVGAATTHDRVEEAALPFDLRRHGTIMGMGACALIVESEDAVRERGMRGIVELLSSETSNSAFHGTRLDVDHISMVMNNLVTAAERRFGLNRYAMAAQTVFMSHETYTPARGGSAAAEVTALRETFGDAANEIIMANTKGFTGHPMGVGVEDVIAVKILEYGIVPPVPNFKVVDPDLGPLNLSRGGRYPVQYAIHLAAGFGSQISMTLTRRIPGSLDRTDNKPLYQHWLSEISGYDTAEVEVEKRVLRVKAQGSPTRSPAPNRWQYGTGPALRALAGDGAATAQSPARMVIPAAAPSAAKPIVPAPAPASPASPPPPPPVVAKAEPVAPPLAPTFAPAPEPVTPVVSSAPAAAKDAVSPALQPTAVSAADAITSQVLTLVAAQTGYPEDMLDLDLDLEADLGIDTVKQAETFAAIREEFAIPARSDINLRAYNTLEKVVGFVREMRPDLAVSAPPVVVSQPVTAVPPIPPSPAPASPTADEVTGRVVALVAEQTGYPEDMLDMDLDLEADLGIDTVKQAETFAAIREEFAIPARSDLNLRAYNTLEKVVGFVREMRPDLAVSAQPVAVSQPATAVPPATPSPAPVITPSSAADALDADAIASKVLALVAEQTGYPEDMLEMDLDLEADLGIDTVKQAETFAAIRETFDIPARSDLNLRAYNTLEKVVGFVREMRPDLAVSAQPEADSQAATAVPAITAAPAPSNTPAGVDDTIASQVLALVAEQTGYPEEMLELDLDMEADLGIDTVKQAETFAAIRQTFDIPRRDNLNLREYNTLERVIEFVKEMRPDLASSESPVASPAVALSPQQPQVAQPIAPTSAYRLEDADMMPRRVATAVIRPSLSLCKPTGVTLGENGRVVVAMDEGGIGKALTGRLRKMGVTVLSLDAGKATDLVEKQLNIWLAEGPVQGVYWLPALDVEPAVDEMDLATWRELNRVRVKNLYTTMRALYESVSAPGSFLVSATRMGGLHGYGPDGASAPLGGAVTGFTKAYKRERPDVLVKAVDFEASRKTAQPADLLIAETLSDPGVVEVGYVEEQRFTVTFVEKPAADGTTGLTLNRDTVFVVTGAAGGITSEIIADLAANSGGVFYLLDLVAEPRRDDGRIALFRSDKEALKQQLIEEMKAAGERPTPAVIEKKLMTIERDEAALRTIEAVEAAGGAAHYHSVNLLDGAAVTTVIEDVRKRYGRIDVLVHAGGIEISKILPDKPVEQFNLVFDIKADGFFSLLNAAKGMPIGATVVFSSVAGRFGNNGQTDYSAANDLLCKLTSSLRTTRPDTKGIAIDWTAWGGIGMASRGSLPKIMAMAGIDMLPPEAGVPTVRRELVASDFKGEIVVGGALGMMVAEFDETGGLDLAKVEAFLTQRRKGAEFLLVGKVTGMKLYGGLQVETTLDPAVQPFLFDHAPDEGTPWLPGVMATEALAELATALVPGYAVTAVTDEQMSGAFKFFRNEPRTLHLSAVISPAADGELVAAATLRSITPPAREGLPQREQQHFAANVWLAAQAPITPAIAFTPPAAGSLPTTAAEIYKVFFHGPAYQVLAGAKVDGMTAVGLMADNLPPNTSPAEAKTLMAPRLVELCFQLAALWNLETQNAMGFPLGFASVTAYRQPEEAAGRRLYALLNTADGEHFDVQVVDDAGQVYVTLRQYRTVARPG